MYFLSGGNEMEHTQLMVINDKHVFNEAVKNFIKENMEWIIWTMILLMAFCVLEYYAYKHNMSALYLAESISNEIAYFFKTGHLF